MVRIFVTACAAALLMTGGAANAHKLIEANEDVSVAKSDLTVSPAIQWNRISQRPGSDAERWTLDGELLNDVLFFGAIADGDTLLREVDRRNNPLPKFSSSMLLIDLPDFLNATLRIAKGHQTFDVEAVEPTDFLGAQGVRIEFKTVGSDDIVRRGQTHAAIIDGELYMMTFEAPAIFFYGRDVGHFEQLVASARLD